MNVSFRCRVFNFEMIQYIDAKDIIVVTNGMTHVEQLLKYGIKTLMIGGQIERNDHGNSWCKMHWKR